MSVRRSQYISGWVWCTHLASLLLGELLRGLHSVKRDEPKRRIARAIEHPPTQSPRDVNSPSNHFTPTFPIFTPLETGIACYQLLQVRVQLILRAHSELKRISKGNKPLRQGKDTDGVYQ